MAHLCIIPARGGSRGIPRKNLASVAGKPLIAWSIEQARAAASVDRVVVSTEDVEIARVAREWGAEVPFLRPAELATDTAATEPVLIHALQHLARDGYHPESVLLLQATCPIRKPGSIDGAFERLAAKAGDSLLSVREIHPFLWRNEAEPSAGYDFLNRPRRQDIAPSGRLFEETGSIYITKTELLLRTRNRLGGKIVIYPMDSDESWDIDTPSDLAVASLLLGRVQRK